MYVDEQLITNETRTPMQANARGRKAIDLDRVYTDTFLNGTNCLPVQSVNKGPWNNKSQTKCKYESVLNGS